MRKYWRLIGSALLCALLLVGCSDDAGPGKTLEVREGGTTQAAVEKTARATAASSELSVTITPRTATVNTELRAIAGGNPANPEFTWKINGIIVDSNKSNRLPVGNYVKGDQVAVTMTSAMGTASDATVIANSPPRITASRFVEPRLHTGVDIEISADTEDADADAVEVRYTWKVNGEEVLGLDDNRLSAALLHRGDRIAFTAVPNDGTMDGPPYIVSEFVIPNGAPRFVSTYPLAFSNFIYRYPARAEDPDGDPLSYQLESGPEGMSIDPQSGELYWKVITGQSGEYHVKITAADEEGLQATQEFTLTVTIAE